MLLIVVGFIVVLFPVDDQVAIVILIQFLMEDLQKVKRVDFVLGIQILDNEI